jgi:hypothetical protein
MPSELRHVVFRLPEAVDAAVQHLRLQNRPMPRGTVGEAKLVGGEEEGGAPVALQIAVHGDGPPGVETLEVAGEDLLGALMHLCRRRCVPLPQRGTKSVERYGARLALVVHLPDKGAPIRAR